MWSLFGSAGEVLTPLDARLRSAPSYANIRSPVIVCVLIPRFALLAALDDPRCGARLRPVRAVLDRSPIGLRSSGDDQAALLPGRRPPLEEPVALAPEAGRRPPPPSAHAPPRGPGPPAPRVAAADRGGAQPDRHRRSAGRSAIGRAPHGPVSGEHHHQQHG